MAVTCGNAALSRATAAWICCRLSSSACTDASSSIRSRECGDRSVLLRPAACCNTAIWSPNALAKAARESPLGALSASAMLRPNALIEWREARMASKHAMESCSCGSAFRAARTVLAGVRERVAVERSRTDVCT